MPVRRRVSKRRTLDWKARGTLWSLHRWVEHWGSDEAARDAWFRFRDDLTRHGRRPPPFWAYEPEVPDELRHEPNMQPMHHGSIEAAIAAHRDFDLRRFRWLAATGHLLDEEIQAIRARPTLSPARVEILDKVADK